MAPNTDNGPTKQFFIDIGFYERRPPQEELYDLSLDPNERNNLVDESRYEDIRMDLRERLDEWMKRTGDPLLAGPVSKPEGAVIDRQDAIHSGVAALEASNAR
ncbi:hypothetical protein BRC91_00680 [Halobacteriales archaeon QS_4_62_28]|nr:MAG: hypothetical protein BRC91_00680 [Halobacteriales archaeon QS_4_62_28]